MTNRDLISATKDIVISMINSKLLTTESRNEVNNEVNKAIEEVYNKLAELNLKPVAVGKTTRGFETID